MKTIRNIFYLIVCFAVLFAGCAEDPKMPDNDFGAEVPTLTLDSLGIDKATVYGKIVRENGAKVTEKGFYLYKEGEEENSPNKISEVEEGEDGVFYYTFTALEDATKYYVYAYAENSVGEKTTDTLLLLSRSGSPINVEAHYPGSSLVAGSAAYVSANKTVGNPGERMLGYLIGGSTGDALSNEFWEFNPVEQSWKELEPMPEKRIMASSVYTTSTIVVFGGKDEEGLPTNDMFHYLSGWSITSQKNTPPARYASVSGFANGYMYLIGGILIKNNVKTITNEVYTFDIWSNLWAPHPSFPENQCNGFAFVVGTKLYAGLGYTSLDDSQYSKRLYSISGNEETWTTLPEMSGSKALGGTVVGTNIYVVDDQGDIHIFDTVEGKWRERAGHRKLPLENRKIHCVYGFAGFAGSEKIYIGFGEDSKTVISYDTSWDN